MNGRRTAAGALYATYFRFVRRVLLRMGVPPASIDDAVQDVFVVVHRRIGDIDEPAKTRSWIYGIVVRTARTHRRGLRRRRIDSGADPDELPDRGAPTGEDYAKQRQGLELLERLLGALKDERREVLVLVELEQMTTPEVAELLGVNVNTVSTRLRAARKDLERAYARERRRSRPKPR